MWSDERNVKKYETFFGPNANADVFKIDAEKQTKVRGQLYSTVTDTGTTVFDRAVRYAQFMQRRRHQQVMMRHYQTR